MTDKLTDNEIKKALECCCGGLTSDWCDKCPMNVTKECDKDLLALEKLALDLINRLQARIGIYETCNARKDEAIKYLEAENERLEDVNIRLTKAEAYKEFAERLKEQMYQSSDWSHGEHPFVVEESDIDNTLYELVGEENAK